MSPFKDLGYLYKYGCGNFQTAFSSGFPKNTQCGLGEGLWAKLDEFWLNFIHLSLVFLIWFFYLLKRIIMKFSFNAFKMCSTYFGAGLDWEPISFNNSFQMQKVNLLLRRYIVTCSEYISHVEQTIRLCRLCCDLCLLALGATYWGTWSSGGNRNSLLTPNICRFEKLAQNQTQKNSASTCFNSFCQNKPHDIET